MLFLECGGKAGIQTAGAVFRQMLDLLDMESLSSCCYPRNFIIGQCLCMNNCTYTGSGNITVCFDMHGWQRSVFVLLLTRHCGTKIKIAGRNCWKMCLFPFTANLHKFIQKNIDSQYLSLTVSMHALVRWLKFKEKGVEWMCDKRQ